MYISTHILNFPVSLAQDIYQSTTVFFFVTQHRHNIPHTMTLSSKKQSIIIQC